jgi:hypothetical protein
MWWFDVGIGMLLMIEINYANRTLHRRIHLSRAVIRNKDKGLPLIRRRENLCNNAFPLPRDIL